MHRFTIKRKIRHTLLGATYECDFSPADAQATCSRPRSPVALKRSSLTMRKRVLATLQGQARDDAIAALDDPERERRVVAALIASGGHVNVLQCYDHFTTRDDASGDECVCLVTEFCDSGDLFSYLCSSSTTRGVGERKAVALVLQVARGVAFLQSRLGLAHRDLSLENVLLRRGTCKLADFGLAVPLGERCRGAVGKAAYMAPEVVASRAARDEMKEQDGNDDVDGDGDDEGYDPASADVWSLGVMLFMLLTGSPLVGVASRQDPGFVALTRRGVDAILSAWRVDASVELARLLDAMLDAQPNCRPPLAQIVASLECLDAAAQQASERQRDL